MSDDGAPRVTVAVPLHDGVAYLEQAVASLLAQTYRAWTAVLVDDASTDGTLELARRLAQRDPARIRVVALERNVGVARARDVAIQASGDAPLVALLDQDDVLEPRFLERSVELFRQATAQGRRVGLVACDAWILDAAGARRGTFSERYGWTDVVTLDAMIGRNCVCARTVFSREAYDRAGGFAPETQPSDDYDLWLRMLEGGFEVVTTRDVLAGYRLHDAATSRDHARMAQATLVVHGRALRRGAATPAQRRALRARMRHHRALRERALLRQALAERRPAAAAGRAVPAAVLGAVAFAQAPSRWAEWLLGPLRRGRD